MSQGKGFRRALLLMTGYTVVCLLALIFLGCSYFLVPKLEARLADRGVALPTSVALLIKASHWATRNGWMALLAMILTVIVGWFGVMLRVLFAVVSPPNRPN